MSYVDLLRKVLERTGHVELPSVGDSMLPNILPGDTLEVTPLNRDQLQVGHVVVIPRSNRLVAHRVVEIRGDTVRTAGDNSFLLDQPARLSELLGCVCVVRRNGERIPVSDRLPFPVEGAPSAVQAAIQVVHVKAEERPDSETDEVLREAAREGVPVLAVAEQGRGDRNTLAYYLTNFRKVILLVGALSGYGNMTVSKVNPYLITEAIRLPAGEMAPAWLEA